MLDFERMLKKSTPYLAGIVFLALGLPLLADLNIRALYQYVAGNAGICSFLESWRSGSQIAHQINRFRDLQKISKVTKDAGDGTELWHTPDGDWWVPMGSNDAILYDLSEQDRDIYWTTSGGIRPGDLVLDCGANVGVFTKKALAAGARHVVAIEPAPENLKVLKKNLAAEIAAGKVTIYEKGVWDKDDILKMNIDPTNSAADSFVRDRPGSTTIELPLTTIDKLVAELGLERVDFIKMDIEGAERQAVAGATETIKRFRPRMALCLYHLPDDPTVIPAAVLKIDPGYRFECGCTYSSERVLSEVAHFRLK